MRPHRLAALALLLAACRREAQPPARAQPRAPAPAPLADVPPPPPREGLSVALTSASPARHPAGSDAWLVTLNLLVHNPAAEPLPLRASAFHVTRDEGTEGSLDAPGGLEGPATVAPGARVPARVTAVFAASPERPYAIGLRFDTAGPNQPLSFPIPRGP